MATKSVVDHSVSKFKRKYPKCVPASVAARMTESERRSAVARKRKAQKKVTLAVSLLTSKHLHKGATWQIVIGIKKILKKYRKGDKFKVRTITLDSGKKVMRFLEDDELKLINALNLRPTIDK